jgi:hypothetical protein
MPSSYDANLKNDIVLDSATLYFDPVTPGTMVKFGGTRGGLTFSPNRELRAIPFDGARGETEGLHRFIDGVPTLTANVIVFGQARLEALEPGSTTSDTGTDPSVIRRISPLAYSTMLATTDYHKWEAVGKRGNGGTIKIVFPRGIAMIESIAGQDNNEHEASIVIRAVNDADDILSDDTPPAPYYYELTGSDIVEP